MEINGKPVSIAVQSSMNAKAQVLPELKSGAVVEAKVVNSSSLSNGTRQVQVLINARLTELVANIDLKRGDILKLSVERTATGMELKLLELSQAGQSLTSAARPPDKESFLRHFVPVQRTLNTLVAQIQAKLSDPLLPSDIKSQLSSILNQVPRSQSLTTPQAVAAAMKNSGLFFEAIQARGQLPADTDLKLGLLTLITKLRTLLPPNAKPVYPEVPGLQQTLSVPQLQPVVTARQSPVHAAVEKSLDVLLLKLLGIAESANARTSLVQLATADAQQQGEQRWKFEIPLFFPNQEIGVADIVISRDQEKEHHEETDRQDYWQVRMAIDFPNLGPLQASIKLNELQVSLLITVSDNRSEMLVNDHLDRLKDQLKAQGLMVGQLRCLQGEVTTTGTGKLSTQILNLKA